MSGITSRVSVQWFWRVWIWCLIDVDIPRLSSSGIQSVVTASCTLIPSNPQVPILPFHHHSMLLLSNQPSDAKAVTSNPHPLFLLSLTNRLDIHEPLNTQSINRQLLHHFKQARFHSIHFQWDHKLREDCEEWNPVVWRVEFRNLWVSFSQNASGNLINIVHGSTDRVVGELRTLTSHAGLLPHHSNGEEKSDESTARSFSLTVYPKDRRRTTGIGVTDIG